LPDPETSTLRSRRYAAFVGCCLIWGSTFMAIRVGNQTVPPLWAATLRLVLAAPLLAVLVAVRGDRWPRGEALKGAVLYGVFNFGVNLACLYWGERVVPSGIAAVLFATTPLTTALVAKGFGVERLVPRKVAAAGVALAGVATIFAGEMRLDVPFEGLAAVFLAATAASLAAVLLKRAPKQPSVFATNAIGCGVGALVCVAGSIALGEDRALPGSVAAWWPVIYLTVAGSLGAYVLYTWLLAHWSATNASYVGVGVPVIAVVLGAALLGETRAPLTYLGAAIVVASVVVALREGGGAH
jgi:drug/metabolite transporter (DMT)-like permease